MRTGQKTEKPAKKASQKPNPLANSLQAEINHIYSHLLIYSLMHRSAYYMAVEQLSDLFPEKNQKCSQ